VLTICNDRPALLAALEELAGEIDPLSQVRLARLHGRPMPDRLDLRQTARWAECRSAVDHCRDAPQLRLDA
jgi:beta-N-acetylhexosaminidase